jgi:hypothetical protein
MNMQRVQNELHVERQRSAQQQQQLQQYDDDKQKLNIELIRLRQHLAQVSVCV